MGFFISSFQPLNHKRMQNLKQTKLYLLIACIFSLTSVFGQKTIKGVVIGDQIDPMPGVNVIIKGTRIGTVTDVDGRFSIIIDSVSLTQIDTTNLKLVFTSVGYSSLEIDAEREVIAFLPEETQALSEVVVTGRQGRQPKKKYVVIKVFYGTDRASEIRDDAITFTGERGPVSYGSCNVSVPIDRAIGSIPEPSFLKFEFSRDPNKHFVLGETVTLNKASLITQINERLSKSQGKNAFIFIHGYNVSFRDAALRTAQMAKDLNFDGVPIFYSWPSKNSFYSYPADESTIEWSEPYIKSFINDVARSTSAENIYLIGHSMGTRGLTGALVSLLNENPDLKPKIREIILAAPDIDVDIFKRDIAPMMVSSNCNLTLYASKNDLALKASMFFHTYKRAGQSGDGLVVVNGIETIDASNVGATDLFGHSYFADTKEILSDILFLIQKRQRAAQRTWLERRLLNNSPYWILKTPMN
jgi:esterase/lipase superfamily enzyme